MICAAGFVDDQGNNKVLHITDFNNSEQLLLWAIREEVINCPLSIGWNTTGTGHADGVDSDLTVLNERFIKNGQTSIIGYDNKGFPFVEGSRHIDLYKVFRNPIIRTSVFNNRYRSLKLNDVALH